LVKYDLLSVRGETRLEADFQGGYSAVETQIFRRLFSPVLPTENQTSATSVSDETGAK